LKKEKKKKGYKRRRCSKNPLWMIAHPTGLKEQNLVLRYVIFQRKKNKITTEDHRQKRREAELR
jgi:hypothetical protein